MIYTRHMHELEQTLELALNRGQARARLVMAELNADLPDDDLSRAAIEKRLASELYRSYMQGWRESLATARDLADTPDYPMDNPNDQ